MNSLKLSGAVVALSILLSGCNTTSKTDFENGQAVISGSPAIRKAAINECIPGIRAFTKTEKENLAALMNVSVSQVPSVFCSRMIHAIANKRITHADYLASQRGGSLAPVIKVLQGR